MIGNARLIEQFSDKTALYMDRSGIVWIVHNDTKSPVIYSIGNSQSLVKHRSHIERISSSGDVVQISIANETDNGSGEEVDLLRSLYPWIDDTYWQCINGIESSSEDKLKVCQFFNLYRKLIGKSYPYQYLVLICFSTNCQAIMDDLKCSDWNITAEHLSAAIGVKQLTQGQRQFIRKLRFNSLGSMDSYPALLKHVIDNWDRIGHKFQHVTGMEAFTLLMMVDAFETLPALIDAPWYTPAIFEPDDTMACLVEQSVDEAWQYICATQGDIDVDDFIISTIKNISHLYRLKREADIYFEQMALTHAIQTYPDDYQFPEPDFEYMDGSFIHIKTVGELRRYAADLKNCAASYAPYIAKGKYSFFYYEQEMQDTGVVEKGMLQLCTRTLNQLLNSHEPPRWDNFRSNRIIRQFRGQVNLDMSDWAWSALESFIAMNIVSEWKSRHE